MEPGRLNMTVEALPNGSFRVTSADIPALHVQDDAIAGALQAAHRGRP